MHLLCFYPFLVCSSAQLSPSSARVRSGVSASAVDGLQQFANLLVVKMDFVKILNKMNT